MISDIAGGIAEGLAAPRKAMRRILSGPGGIDVILGLVVASYLVQALAAIAVPGGRIAGDLSPLLVHLNLLISQLVLFVVTSAAVFGIGRLFGGTGTLPQALLTVAWYGFVTSFLAPLALIAFAPGSDAEPTAFDALLLLAVSGIGVWVLAGCVAELHGFRSTGQVLAVAVGIAFGAGVLLISLVPAP